MRAFDGLGVTYWVRCNMAAFKANPSCNCAGTYKWTIHPFTNISYVLSNDKRKEKRACIGDLNHDFVKSVRSRLKKNAIHCEHNHLDTLSSPSSIGSRNQTGILAGMSNLRKPTFCEHGDSNAIRFGSIPSISFRCNCWETNSSMEDNGAEE